MTLYMCNSMASAIRAPQQTKWKYIIRNIATQKGSRQVLHQHFYAYTEPAFAFSRSHCLCVTVQPKTKRF